MMALGDVPHRDPREGADAMLQVIREMVDERGEESGVIGFRTARRKAAFPCRFFVSNFSPT